MPLKQDTKTIVDQSRNRTAWHSKDPIMDKRKTKSTSKICIQGVYRFQTANRAWPEIIQDVLCETTTQKVKRKPKKRKIKSTPSGRKRRRMADAPAANHLMEESANCRKVNETRKKFLCSRRSTHALLLSWGSKMKHWRAENNEEFGQIMLQTIQKLVDILNTAKRLAQLSTDLLMRFVMQKYSNNDPPSNQRADRSLLL
jgi:transcriptional regulator of aromatic amino acid metabolism